MFRVWKNEIFFFKRGPVDQRGFALIELMVVVGIIGILATIGMANYKKFSARARQAEAKANLSAIFVAEKGFFSEYSSYTGCLNSAGYGPPPGKRYYSIGFSQAVAVTGQFQTGPNSWQICAAPGCCGNGLQPCNLPDFNPGATPCITIPGVNSQIAYSANAAVSGGGFPGDIELGQINPILTQTQFSVPAIGFVSENGNLDVWSINDQKMLLNFNPGL